RLAAGAAALPAVPRIARAQAYPSRPVRLVVGFPPGGTNDIHARLIADWVSKQFGRSFFVENRPGAARNIAPASGRRALADGSTHVARALSRWGAGSHGRAWPAGTGLLRYDRGCDGTHQGRQIACACGHRRNPHTSVAGCSDYRRICTWL